MIASRRVLALLAAAAVGGGLIAPAVQASVSVDVGDRTPAERLDVGCETYQTTPAGLIVEDLIVATGDLSEPSVHACVVHPEGLSDADVTELVVFAHGNGHVVQESWVQHQLDVVARAEAAGVHVVTVSTNYRDNYGFPTLRGAEDLIAATNGLRTRFTGIERTTLFGVSMGGAISGTALHVSDPDGPAGPLTGLFDVWFDVEGVTNTLESYAEASAALPAVARGMERDANGSTPATDPNAWALRTPILNVTSIAAAGVTDAVVVHAAFDGLVPIWQGRSMAAAMEAAGINTERYTVVRGSKDQERSDTTPLAHTGQAALVQANEDTIDLAGHGSEADTRHPVMRTALDRLIGLLTGDRPFDGPVEWVVDDPFAS